MWIILGLIGSVINLVELLDSTGNTQIAWLAALLWSICATISEIKHYN